MIAPSFRVSVLAAVTFFLVLTAVHTAEAQNRALLVSVDALGDKRLAGKAANTSAADIAAMEKLLSGTLRFKKDEIKILRGKQATKEAILEGLTVWLRPDREAVEQRRKDEEAIEAGKLNRKQIRALQRKWRRARRKPRRSYFYYSGPGYSRQDIDGDEADGYDEAIVPFDAKVIGSGESAGLAGIISDDDFSEALKTLEGRDVTVVLDTSHSPPGFGNRKPGANSRTFSLAGEQDGNASPSAPANPEAGNFVDADFTTGRLAVWAAAVAGQNALVERQKESAAKDESRDAGLFTRLYAEGVGQAKADLNGNGIVSAAELIVYLRTRSDVYCAKYTALCRSGLTPVLYPEAAYALSTGKGRRKRYQLRLSYITDFLLEQGRRGREFAAPAEIERLSDIPLKVGTGNIRFKVTAPRDGKLVLLNLSASGRLSQLYPNHYAARDSIVKPGLILAGKPLIIPDPDYGLEFTVTDPGKGHVIALYTPDAVDLSETVSEHSIGNIPRNEALSDYLPEIAAALLGPVKTANNGIVRSMAEWSVSTLAYEIQP